MLTCETKMLTFDVKVVQIMPKKGQLCYASDLSLIWKALHFFLSTYQ